MNRPGWCRPIIMIFMISMIPMISNYCRSGSSYNRCQTGWPFHCSPIESLFPWLRWPPGRGSALICYWRLVSGIALLGYPKGVALMFRSCQGRSEQILLERSSIVSERCPRRLILIVEKTSRSKRSIFLFSSVTIIRLIAWIAHGKEVVVQSLNNEKHLNNKAKVLFWY